MVFRTQWLLTGGGLLPWRRDAQFLAGMTRYLQVGGSGVGNLTLNGWLPFNLTQTPVRARLRLPRPRLPRWCLQSTLPSQTRSCRRKPGRAPARRTRAPAKLGSVST